jgi:uncharacterized delta-60 repeat protein
MAKDQQGQRSSHPHGLTEPLVPGMRVGGGRYILRRILGRGAVSVVWLARDVKLEQEVALKVLPPSLLQDPNTVERLKGETRRNAELTHPQIVRTYDFVQDYKLAVIAMEYVDGWSLATLRVDRPEHRYRLQEVTPWIRQICAALTYAHTEAGILHLALKPANLLLNSRDHLKLTDFGISRSLQGMADPADAHAAAAILGFLSPQQALGEKPSVLDDVYGLGATIYDLLTGTPPFYKGQVLAQVCDRAPATMTERLAELGIKDSIALVVEDSVAQCLAKDPAKRPKSISHVLQLLERSDIAAPVSVSQPEKPAPPAPAPPPAPVAAPPPEPEPSPIVAEPSEAVPPTAVPARVSRRTLLWAGAASCVVAVAGISAVIWARRAAKGPATPSAPAGSLDEAFNPPTNADHEIRVALQQPDQKLLVAGMFTQFGDGPCQGVARMELDGTLDRSFSGAADSDVFALALQPDGNVLVGGIFTKINSRTCRRMARLNSDGTLDDSFTTKAGVNKGVRAMLVQDDGKIVVGGAFDAVGRRKQNRIARFNADGARDTAFNPGEGASAIVWALAQQPDGKLIVAGDFTTFDQQAYTRVVRLNANGRVDTDFNPGSGADAVIYALAVQPDGKVLIGGDFTRVNQLERNRIARLNADGSVDTTFKPGAGPNTGVRCLALQPDGKILMGGIFTSVDGAPRGRVARLNPDGSLDARFDPGEGASEVVRWVVPQADGNVLVVGGFSTFAGKECVRLARVHGGA